MEHETGYELRPSAQIALDNSGGRPLVVAEIGVREGQNTIAMLKFMPIAHVFMIDGYDPYYSNEHDFSTAEEQEIWYKNMFLYMRPYLNVVTFITRPSKFASELFPKDFFDYIYIDANHCEKSVYEDMSLWLPKVKEGGVLGGHDFDDEKGRFPDVRKAVERFCNDHNLKFSPRNNDWTIIKGDKK